MNSIESIVEITFSPRNRVTPYSKMRGVHSHQLQLIKPSRKPLLAERSQRRTICMNSTVCLKFCSL